MVEAFPNACKAWPSPLVIMAMRMCHCSVCREAGRQRCECKKRAPYAWTKKEIKQDIVIKKEVEEQGGVKKEVEERGEIVVEEEKAVKNEVVKKEEADGNFEVMQKHYYTMKAYYQKQIENLQAENARLRAEAKAEAEQVWKEENKKLEAQVAKLRDEQTGWALKLGEVKGRADTLQKTIDEMKKAEAARIEASKARWAGDKSEGKAGKGGKGGKSEGKASKGGKVEGINPADI